MFGVILILPQEIFGYRTQSCRKTLCLAGYVFSFGILPLVFYWRPAWHVCANCIPCSLQEADVVLLRTTVSVYLLMYLAALFPGPLIMGWLWGDEYKAGVSWTVQPRAPSQPYFYLPRIQYLVFDGIS